MNKPATKTEGTFAGLDPVLANAVQQLTERIQTGQEVDRDFIEQHYADHSKLLLQLLPTIQTLAALNRDEPTANTVGFSYRESLGDFEILREIGRGGMGVVYEARQKSLDRRVALKVLPFAAILDERQLKRFKNEARAAAMLKHPNIVGVHAVGCERGIHFYTMELIDGVSLDMLIGLVHRDKPLDEKAEAGSSNGKPADVNAASGSTDAPPSAGRLEVDTAPIAAISTAFSSDRKSFYRNVARLGIQIAEALHHAHQEGIVHRDVKPSNILLDRDGHVHVADFGLAQIQSSEALTRSGDVIGTLRYMSPEQIDGSSVSDQRTDVYALGLTLYELVTGRAAIDGANRKEMLAQIIDDEVPKATGLDRQIPKDLETIIHKAMHRDADCRFSSARQLADDLSRFHTGRPILSRPVTRRERLRRWIGRNPRVAALMAIVFCLLLTLSVGGPWMAIQQRDVAREKSELARALELQLYDTNITSAAALVEKGDFVQAEELLRQYEASPLRSFEWHHLWNQCRDILDLPSDYWWAPRYGLAHSPTEDLIAWCSWDAKVSVANAESLETIWRQSNHNLEDPKSRGHTTVVNDITFIHSGSFIASSSRDGSVRIWDSRSGKVVHVIDQIDAIPQCLASNDRQQLLAVSLGEADETDASARIELYRWNVDPADEFALSFSGALTTPGWRMGSLSISSDGRYLAGATGVKSTKLSVWDLETREPIEVPQQHGLVTNVCFSPLRSSELAFTVSLRDDANELGSIYLLDLQENVIGKPILIHRSAFTRMEFSRDGSALACGTADGFVVFGDLQGQRRLGEFRLHSHTVHDVTFSADGQHIVATSANGTACRFPIRMQGANVRLTKEGGGDAVAVSLSENGQLFAGFGDGTYGCWDCVSGELLGNGQLDVQYAYGVAISPDGKHAAVAGGFWPEESGPGEIRLHRVGDMNRPIFKQVNPGSISFSATCSPADDLIAVSDGPDIRLWQLPDMRELPRLRLAGMKAAIRAMDFSADGKYLAVLEFDEPSRAHVWDVYGQEVVSSVSLREKFFNAIAISSAGDRIVVPTPNGDLQVLNALTGKYIKSIGNHPRALFALDFSSDDRRLLSAGWNGEVRLWNVETGARLMTWNVDGQIWSACFSPDGNKIAFDNRPYRDIDGSVRVLDGTPRIAEAQED